MKGFEGYIGQLLAYAHFIIPGRLLLIPIMRDLSESPRQVAIGAAFSITAI